MFNIFGGKKKSSSEGPTAPSRRKGGIDPDREGRKSKTLAQMGMFMPPSMDLDLEGDIGMDLDDEDLTALDEANTGNSDEDELENELLELIGESKPPPPLPQKNVEVPNLPSGPVEDIFKAPPPPHTVMEALNQRLARYNEELEKATAQNNANKVKRFGRIVKYYKEAIKAHESGKSFDYDDLPTPPGFGPIPVDKRKTEEIPDTEKATSAPEFKNSSDNRNTVNSSIVSNENPLLIDVESNENASSDQKLESQSSLLDLESDLPTNITTPLVPSPTSETIEKPAPLPRIDKVKTSASSEQNELQQQKVETKSPFKTPPQLPISSSVTEVAVNSATTVPQVPSTASAPKTNEVAGNNVVPPPATKIDIFGAPPPPRTVMEALEQRLTKYESEVLKAKETNNGSKERRMGRIVKQYKEAIADYKKGKVVNFDELPVPPGFGPIPVPVAKPTAGSAAGAASSSPSPSTAPGTQNPSTSPSGNIIRGGKPSGTKLTLQEKQLAAIMKRQKEYKLAALQAKKRGDLEQAKGYLRTAHGFDKLIQASQSGLPVDMATLPSSPEAVASLEADNFEVVGAADCIMASDNVAEVFTKLEEDLKQQLKMCMRTREHYKSIGDVGSANRFEALAIETKKDLDALRLAAKRGQELPKYHYENRVFSITECNSELQDNELEVCVIQGVNYKVPNPNDVDTFVRVELQYPSAEECQSNKSHVVKGTNNPKYDVTYKFDVQRSSRKFQRFVHRHGVKIEVWSKGGFLSRSSLLGTATAKLAPLETKCTLHDGFDILDGRKPIGKLEVKIRLREPVLTKQISQKKEKWLSIDRV